MFYIAALNIADYFEFVVAVDLKILMLKRW